MKLIDLADPVDRRIPLNSLKKYDCIIVRNIKFEGEVLRLNEVFAGEIETDSEGRKYAVCARAA